MRLSLTFRETGGRKHGEEDDDGENNGPVFMVPFPMFYTYQMYKMCWHVSH